MWKINKKEIVFSCPWFEVEKENIHIPKEKIDIEYFITHSPDIVTIVALNDNNEILILKEYKHGYDGEMYTLPSGIMEKNEQPISAARRELLEETGYKAKKMTLISKSFPNPTSGKFAKFTFLATGIEKIAKQCLDKTEKIKVYQIPIAKVFQMINENKLISDLNIASFFIVMARLGKIDLI